VATKLVFSNVVLDDLVIERLELILDLVNVITSLDSSVFSNLEIDKDFWGKNNLLLIQIKQKEIKKTDRNIN